MVSKGETLLSPSSVKLYGRVVKGLTISLEDARDELGNNKFLRSQLDPGLNEEFEPVLARIYGYSYLGQYQPLNAASLFLVHGEGELAASSVDASGVAAKSWEFSSDIRVWEYDRADFSLRLDVDSGSLERILLSKQAEGTELPYFRGRYTRSGGSEE